MNGLADFKNDNSSVDRLAKLDVELSPWKHRGNYWLIVGQVHGDASIQHLDFQRWLTRIARSIQRLEKHDKIYFRHHPLDTGVWSLPTGVKEAGGPYEAELKYAKCVVTLNSNAGVDALIRGRHVIAADKGSMVYNHVHSHCRRVYGLI